MAQNIRKYILLLCSFTSLNVFVFHSYKFQSSLGAYEDKTAILSDQDTVWTMVRHMHMREAIDKLMADFNKFIQENAVFQGCVVSLVALIVGS